MVLLAFFAVEARVVVVFLAVARVVVVFLAAVLLVPLARPVLLAVFFGVALGFTADAPSSDDAEAAFLRVVVVEVVRRVLVVFGSTSPPSPAVVVVFRRVVRLGDSPSCCGFASSLRCTAITSA